MEQHLKKNFTRYSGFSQKALEYLVKSRTPINQKTRQEVWRELFGRYFNEGRRFNLYALLVDEPVYFAYTVGLELKRPNVDIPPAHIEQFIVGLLHFIDHVDKTVLTQKFEFEWQLHELEGIKDMLDRVRDAKIKDNILRQKINLFIDKINTARKEAEAQTLALLEAAKAQPAPAKEAEQALVAVEQTHQLMQQQLQHLDIPVGKITKSALMEMLKHFETYYPDDQEKILKVALRKWPDDIPGHLCHRAFVANLSFQVSQANMIALALRGLRDFRFDPKALVPGGNVDDAVRWLGEWYGSLHGATGEGRTAFNIAVGKALAMTVRTEKVACYSRFHYQWLVAQVKESLELARAYHGRMMSEALRHKIRSWMDWRIVWPKEAYFDKESGRWIVREPDSLMRDISVMEHFYWLWEHLTDRDTGLLDFAGDFRADFMSSHSTREQIAGYARAEIDECVRVLPSLILDDALAVEITKPQPYPRSEQFKRMMLSTITSHFRAVGLTDAEVKVLYRNGEFQKVFENWTRFMSSSFRGYSSTKDYYNQYIVEALQFFDFAKDEDMQAFFSLPWEAPSEDGKLYAITTKLVQERAHEYRLIADAYAGLGEGDTHNEFAWDEEFFGLSDMEKWTLLRRGINVTGQTVTHQGYKKNVGGETVYVSPERIQAEFVVQFFKTNYAD